MRYTVGTKKWAHFVHGFQPMTTTKKKDIQKKKERKARHFCQRNDGIKVERKAYAQLHH